MTTFRPSARVTLTIRLDEGTDTRDLEARLQDPGETSRASTPRQADPAEEIEDVNAALEDVIARRATIPASELDVLVADLRARREELQRELVAGPGDPPEAIDGAPPDDRVVIGTILPKDLELERNGLQVADTATVTIDYADAPFDPRLIRAVGIEILVGVSDPSDFEAGIRGATRSDGSPTSLVERRTDGGVVGGATRFVGVVDVWSIDLNGEDGDLVKLDCRDMTALFLDQPLPTGFGIDLSEAIDDGVRGLLEQFPSLRGTTVEYGVEGEEGNAPIPAEAIPRTRRGRGGRARRARRGGSRFSVWDHISETCLQVGLVPIVEDYTVRIIRPRTFYPARSRARRMVYGRNLERLGFSRKLAGIKVPTIEVRVYDPEVGRTRWARYPGPPGARAGVFGTDTPPPRAARANEIPPSGSVPEDKVLTFTLQGITDPATLEEAARSIYEQIGRQEIEGQFSTRDSSSYDVDALDADLLSMRSGDAIEILVVAADPQNLRESLATATVIENLSVTARARYLESLGWSSSVAQRFAELQEAAGLQTIFRAQDIRISFDQDDGLRVQADFINFLEVRELAQGATEGQADAPSPEIAEATEGRQDVDSREARRISGLRRQLARQRDLGQITEEDYQSRTEELLERERSALRRTRGQT